MLHKIQIANLLSLAVAQIVMQQLENMKIHIVCIRISPEADEFFTNLTNDQRTGRRYWFWPHFFFQFRQRVAIDNQQYGYIAHQRSRNESKRIRYNELGSHLFQF